MKINDSHEKCCECKTCGSPGEMRKCTLIIHKNQGYRRPYLDVQIRPSYENSTGVENYADTEFGLNRVLGTPGDVCLNLIYEDCMIRGDQGSLSDQCWLEIVSKMVEYKTDVKYLVVEANSPCVEPESIADCWNDRHFTVPEIYRKVWITLKIRRNMEPYGKDQEVCELQRLDSWNRIS